MPDLTAEEYAALKEDIRQHGVRIPLVKDEIGNILDGHNRDRIRRELEAEGVSVPYPPALIQSGLSEAAKRDLVISVNLARRHLTREQRQELHVRLRQQGLSTREIADRTGADHVTVWRDTAGVSNETPAAVTGRDGKTYPAARPPCIFAKTPREEKMVLDSLQQLPPDALPDKPVSPWRVGKLAEKHRLRVEHQERAADLDAASALHNLDFLQAGALVADNSVDLIFTDPQYEEDYLPLYGDLGRFAARVLRPGGLLLAYTGHMHLPRVLSLLSESLEFFWPFAITHANTKRKMFFHQLRVGWKPIVGFAKPPVQVWWDSFLDTTSGGREKEFHPWQQAVAEAEHYVRNLCPEGGLICDPFAGSGTTLIAAERLGRKWVGFEINADTAARARQRIAEARKAAASGAEIR